ncbi:MAG TPA: hypothetical protein V6C72_02110 [Chroococcales cyanobacterium]
MKFPQNISAPPKYDNFEMQAFLVVTAITLGFLLALQVVIIAMPK